MVVLSKRRRNQLLLVLRQFLAIVCVAAFPIETAPRKRLGRASFIEKQSHDKASKEIASADELNDLARKNALRKRGSGNYRKAWKHWSGLGIESIRHDLSENLPFPIDRSQLENLFFHLGVAADKGEMPSFSNPGARSGYALEFFCRARLLADLLMDVENPTLPAFWNDAILETSIVGDATTQYTSYNITSLGGGPGFDFVAAALVATFSSAGSSQVGPIHATILDYEEGWSDLVHSMNCATKSALQQPHISCSWGGKCDITKPLDHPNNSKWFDTIGSTQVWSCQYCVAENTKELRESEYIFFRELFEAAPEGALFVFTETTPRIWPEFYNLVVNHCPYMEVGFPRKRGPQMVLRKSQRLDGYLLSESDSQSLQKFEKISEYHERRLGTGWERERRKIRGLTSSNALPAYF